MKNYESDGVTMATRSINIAYEDNEIEYFSDCPTPTNENSRGMIPSIETINTNKESHC